jgi:hypothetical protein
MTNHPFTAQQELDRELRLEALGHLFDIEEAAVDSSVLADCREAVERWLTSVGASSRQEEADYLQDFSARMIAIFLEATRA